LARVDDRGGLSWANDQDELVRANDRGSSARVNGRGRSARADNRDEGRVGGLGSIIERLNKPNFN